jgi:hypothetical protein
MQGDDRLSARSSIQRLRLPQPAAWAALASLFFTFALIVFVVRAQPTIGPFAPSARFRVAGEFFGKQSSLLLVLSVVLLLLTLWAVRRYLFAQLVRRPGPVEILPFVQEQGTEAPAENIAAHFRKALRDVSLSPPMSMPGEPVSQDFLQVLRTATSQATGTVGAVVGMLSALQVNGAYRVSAVLRKRDKDPGFGLTVQIVTLPKNTGGVKTFWADDWLEVAELGAHYVGAYVLPRSRICTRPPWTAWRRLPIPDDLFHSYQVAQSMLREERFEEALDALYSALREDPQNPYLRIQVAQLREQLGQHLDAVTDYVDIIEIQAWQDRRLWRRLRQAGHPPGDRFNPGARQLRSRLPKRIGEGSGGLFVRRGTHRNCADALLVARYRLASALVRGSRLALQWYEEDLDGNPRRGEERQMLRDRLRKWLIPRYQEFCLLRADQGATDDFPDDFDDFVHNHHELLPLLFVFVAVRETNDLISDYSWLRGRRRLDMSIPQSALGVWAALHLIQAERAAAEKTGSETVYCDDKYTRRIRDGLDRSRAGWPPDPRAVESLIDGVLRWKPRARQGWQEHYNAASAFAVLLLDGNGDAERSEQIAIEAVRRLERAVLTIGSGLSSQYSKWLAFGDQDLNGLRRTASFTDFSDRYFPRSAPRKATRPREMLEQVLWAHITGLIAHYAAVRAEFWESRTHHSADPLTAEEAQRERDVASMVQDYIRDYWSWQVRLRLIREAQRFAKRLGDSSSFASSFPPADIVLDVAADEADGAHPDTADRLAATRHAAFSASGTLLSEHIRLIETGLPTILGGDADDGRGPETEMRRISTVWRTVHQVMDTAVRSDPETIQKVRTSFGRVTPVTPSTEPPAVEHTPPGPTLASSRPPTS